MAQSQVSIGSIQFVDESGVINGGALNGGQGNFTTLVKTESMKRSAGDAGLELDCDDTDSDSDSVASAPQPMQSQNPNGIKPGKKTKGRVKIKMEFIENKLRRYTTFSKRKTGIMKKAYELSTLTGTQVMLLVASETGHVYTFATRKLQPMITSDSGKALIQTCLNSPDALSTPPGQQHAVEQRMNPTGFEETELSYAVGEEDQQKAEILMPKGPTATFTHLQQPPSQSPSPVSASPSPASSQPQAATSQPQTISMTTYLAPSTTSASQKPTNISMQLPTGGIATLLPSSTEGNQSFLNYMQGTPITIPMQQPQQQQQQQSQQQHQQQQQQQSSAQQAQQAVYRFPAPQPGQVVSLSPGIPQPQNLVKVTESSGGTSTSSHQQQQGQQQQSQQQQQNIMLQALANGGSGGNTGGTLMYQTPQGIVYASATAATMNTGTGLSEGFILNLPQTPTLQLTQDQSAAGGQQFITIPVPVTIATHGGSAQMFQPVFAQASSTPTTTAVDMHRATPDKSRK